MSGYSIAAGLVRAWTWLYTLPLDVAARDGRRAEIASDLWEFRNDPCGGGRWRGVHVLARAALGVPDDLLWIGEQLPAHVYRPRRSAVVTSLVAVLAASGLVVSASAPVLDPARALRVDVTASGWTTVARSDGELVIVPVFAFTLENVGDHPTGALQVNAVFSTGGTAYSPAVGWRGLRPGAATRPVVLRGNDGDPVRPPLAAAVADLSADAPTVKLLVQHEGHWTLLGRFPVRAQLVRR
ncbi:MAG: hypothetical protein ACM3SQ_16690 [Betaproteobacteria bacterium]